MNLNTPQQNTASGNRLNKFVITLSFIALLQIIGLVGWIYFGSKSSFLKQQEKPKNNLILNPSPFVQESTPNCFNRRIYTNLPEALREYPMVCILDLSHQNMPISPIDIAKFTNLTTLSLVGNSMTRLPAEIFTLTNLKNLDISNNSIMDLPQDINRLKYLEELNVSNNKLTNLSITISGLTHLKKLDISNNNISAEKRAQITKLLPSVVIKW